VGAIVRRGHRLQNVSAIGYLGRVPRLRIGGRSEAGPQIRAVDLELNTGNTLAVGGRRGHCDGL